jgi:hypothetical protein
LNPLTLPGMHPSVIWKPRRSAPPQGMLADAFPATNSKFRRHHKVHRRLLVRKKVTARLWKPRSHGALIAWSPASNRRQGWRGRGTRLHFLT